MEIIKHLAMIQKNLKAPKNQDNEFRNWCKTLNIENSYDKIYELASSMNRDIKYDNIQKYVYLFYRQILADVWSNTRMISNTRKAAPSRRN